LDIWRIVMPVQIIRKPRTTVRIWVTVAWRPWYRMIDVTRVQKVKMT